MFQFAQLQYFYLLLAVPLLIIIFMVSQTLRKRALKKFGNLQLLQKLMPDVSNSRPIVKFIFLVFGLIALIVGIAGPQVGTKLEDINREGVEIIIALDVSNSMLAEDIQPNRLERARRAISKLVEQLKNDKFGLIVFAGDAYTQLPITTDFSAAKMFLSTVNTGFVQKQGTSIGSAIELGAKSFGPDESSKTIIVITDGENHEDDAIEAAKIAAEKGITVHTIGMGLPKGAPIPIKGRYGQFRKNKLGEVVISKLNEPMLQEIALAGKGVYVRASNTQSALKILFDEIEKMEKQEISSSIYSEYEERFQYFIGIAIFFLLLDFVLLDRKNKLFREVNIFKV
ncbi:MAG: VWA domain-containing protein [Bacteroidetes bacterium]|jgi:Ca-activated chloride channel homolog|nr:VWA domain-containing protein [Bacteroidota bacterium]MBT6687672.1 VWA domain-containing protein [Bacteroidota bacterium]MBT7142492.1 VWA domain-containing protein [Bacteroidota bacterium]MBT7493344.1 VWA domain-containing protein [Bacteroidota bacterium]